MIADPKWTPARRAALDAEGRAWDEGPAPLPLNLRPEPLCPVDGFAAPPGNPGARVIRTG